MPWCNVRGHEVGVWALRNEELCSIFWATLVFCTGTGDRYGRRYDVTASINTASVERVDPVGAVAAAVAAAAAATGAAPPTHLGRSIDSPACDVMAAYG